MNTKLYTESDLATLQSMPKRVVNPRAHWLEKPRTRPVYRQRGFQVSGGPDDESRFLIYQRENLLDVFDYSCGILFIPRGGLSLTLARYNGPSHEHRDIVYRPHIHRSSEKAIAAGGKPESDAEETERFETLEGALACLIDDFNVTGIKAQHDKEPRFPGWR